MKNVFIYNGHKLKLTVQYQTVNKKENNVQIK